MHYHQTHISSNDGIQIDSVIAIHGLKQLRTELTHIGSNSLTCINFCKPTEHRG